MNVDLLHKELTQEIIGAFYTVYNEFGYGFAESVYRNSLVLELELRNMKVRREVPVDVMYVGRCFGRYRIDVLVEERVLVETKASAGLVEADSRQLLNYLRASHKQVGLLLHFGPKPGLKRFVWTGNQFHSGL